MYSALGACGGDFIFHSCFAPSRRFVWEANNSGTLVRTEGAHAEARCWLVLIGPGTKDAIFDSYTENLGAGRRFCWLRCGRLYAFLQMRNTLSNCSGTMCLCRFTWTALLAGPGDVGGGAHPIIHR